jgi:hypothetical protein
MPHTMHKQLIHQHFGGGPAVIEFGHCRSLSRLTPNTDRAPLATLSGEKARVNSFA